MLGSLIFLAGQLRQTQRNQRAIMDRGRSVQVSEWLQFIASPDIAPLILRGHSDYASLTADERQRYLWCVYPLLLHYEDSFYQHADGMLGDEQYTSIRNQMHDSARAPGFLAAWTEVRNRFPDAFRTFANSMFAPPE